MSVVSHPFVELTPCGRQALVRAAVNSARDLCRRQLARLDAAGRFNWRRDPHAYFKIEDVRAHLEMMCEDRADWRNALCGEGRHEFADGGSEHFHHLAT